MSDRARILTAADSAIPPRRFYQAVRFGEKGKRVHARSHARPRSTVCGLDEGILGGKLGGVEEAIDCPGCQSVITPRATR